jgi:hypothetical protein
MSEIVKQSLSFLAIADAAGFPADAQGKTNLPPTQETCHQLAAAAIALTGTLDWIPGDDRIDLTLTGPGPVWAYLVIAHALHGRCVRLTYAAPNATIVVWSHGI